jgi:para-aminobenzoate synthetase / 4-amino-4-deoxychorismate lyase
VNVKQETSKILMKTITNNKLSQLLHFLSGCTDFVFLDTAKSDEENSCSHLFFDPISRLRYHHGQDVSGFIQNIEEYQGKGYYVAGWLSYEFGYMIEPALKDLFRRPGDEGTLLADLGVYEKKHTFDHRAGECDFPEMKRHVPLSSSYTISNLVPSKTRQDYVEAIKKILDYIRAGDTYQVNYTLKLLFDFSGSVEALYQELRRNQSVSYGAYIRTGDERILSFSPELFFKKGADSVVVRPMKGTMKRGRTLAEDALKQKELADDIKNRSENVMIVDLLRNDLGRLMHLAPGGEVGVRSLFDVEVYETLLQMTSTIVATTTKEALGSIPLLDFLKSLFPCGSVTGAPKIRTMQIIDELEKDRRGVYTGAIGYLSPTGEAMFNVPIRTVVLDGKKGEMGIGSGIVFDSDPEQEWQECLLKGRFLTKPASEFHLIETLLYHPDDGYILLEEHLQRLSASASYFLFSCDPAFIRKNLLEQACKFNGGCMRVRLGLEKDGTFAITSRQCATPLSFHLPESPSGGELPRISFSGIRTDARSSWFYHKTSRREVYDREFAVAGEKGLFDVCFCNTDGEVTEGCITNIIAYKDGSFTTPPVRCGLLPGVMRGVLLKDRKRPLEEGVLTMEDIRDADALFLCNSVRGVVQVQLTEG